MNGRHAPSFAFVVYVLLSLLSTPVAFAQTGAAATKQMQDTQRAAQQKARKTKNHAHQNTDTQRKKKATPANKATSASGGQ